jgi:hypothetical protein
MDEQKIPRGRPPQGGKSTRVVYVGEDGYEQLLQEAIALSSRTKKQITPAILARWLASNISDASREKLIKEFTTTNAE